MTHPNVYVSPAIEAVRALRAQDDEAAACWPLCKPGTQHAIQTLKAQGQLFEADMLCLAHALQTLVERGNNQLMPHWAAIIIALEGIQAGCSDAINDEAADAIARELITAQAWGGI
jgi:hypothetical protein